MSNPINNQIIDPVALGATAHTSGFVEPNQSSSTSSAIPAASSSTTAPSNASAPPAVTPATAILGSAGIPAQFGYMGGAFGVTNYSSGAGGLQSSPNVPAPGSSIDPSTGKQFSAGMTRAELEAKKAADLSGREQAARQLAGGLETPGKELPGGWGPTPVVPAPGTSASAPASIYEDVNQVLLKVGSTAYAALPASLKEALSNNPEHADKGKQPAGMPSSNRSSVAVMFDNAKKQTTEVIKTLREDTKAPGPIEAEHNRASLKGGPEGRRTSGDAPSLFGQVKEMFQEAYSGHPAGHPTGATGAATFKTSLPSEEPLGARPGEHVSGVGALPGQASETGVAILPDEKVASGSGSLPTQENQGLLPGEVTAGIGALSVSKDDSNMVGTSGSTSGLKGDSSVADELSTPTALGGGALAITKDEPSVTGTSGLTSDLKKESSLAGTSSTTTGLAPPLPQTDLGHGASEGATDVEAAVGASPHVGATDVEGAVGASPDGSAKSSMLSPASAPVPERTDSFASTTAIRHGHEGSHKTSGASPLSAAPVVAAIGEKPTPVSEPRESEKALEQKVAESHAPIGTASSASPATPSKTAGSAIADSPTTKSSPLAAKSNGQSPVGKTAASSAGHDRTASGSSTKKKAGFMSKLKGEMKVISGKIGGDEAKVQAGERMKHGEL